MTNVTNNLLGTILLDSMLRRAQRVPGGQMPASSINSTPAGEVPEWLISALERPPQMPAGPTADSRYFPTKPPAKDAPPPDMIFPPRPTASERVTEQFGGLPLFSPAERVVADAVAQPFVDAYDALSGRMSEQEKEEYALTTMMELAGGGVGNPIRRGFAAAANALSPMVKQARNIRSRGSSGVRQKMYDPPRMPRMLTDDYRGDIPVDSSGKLTRTMDGDDIVAKNVVGWSHVAQPQNRLSDEQIRDVLTKSVGQRPETKALAKEGYFGKTIYNRYTGDPIRVEIDKGLAPVTRGKIERHETGHVIDQIAGLLSTEHLDELKRVYNTLNNNVGRTRYGRDAGPGTNFTPSQRGYPSHEVPREYIAEAIRAYLTDPNYFKTVAPNVAAAIRKAVNNHPKLAPVIQFNSLQFPTFA